MPKIKEVKGLRCPKCDEVIPVEDLPMFPIENEEKLDTFYECPECQELHDSEEEAKDCCK